VSQVAQRVAARYLRGFLRIAKGDGELGPFYDWAKQKYPEVRNPKKDGHKDQITFDTLKGYAGGGDVGAKQVLRRMHQEWSKDYGDESGGESVDNRMEQGPLQEAEWLQGMADNGVKVKGWRYDDGDDIMGGGGWYQEQGSTLPVSTILKNTSRHSRELRELREKYDQLKGRGKLPLETKEQMGVRFERVQGEEKAEVERKEEADRWEPHRPKPEHYKLEGWPQSYAIVGERYKVPNSWGEGGEEFSENVGEALKVLQKNRSGWMKKGPRPSTPEELHQELGEGASKRDEKKKVPRPQSYAEATERTLLWGGGAGLGELNRQLLITLGRGESHALRSALDGIGNRGKKKKDPGFLTRTQYDRDRMGREKYNAKLGKELEGIFHRIGVPGYEKKRTGKPGKEADDLERGVTTAAAFYKEYFAKAGIESLPVVFADGEEDGTREALRFGGVDHDRSFQEVKTPDELVAKKGEYIDQVSVGELLPLLLLRQSEVPVRLPAPKTEALAEVPKKKKPGWRDRFKDLLDKKGDGFLEMEARVAARWLESCTVVG